MAEHDLGEMVGYLGGAVSEIDRLNAENERLRAALQFIARLGGSTSTPAQRMLEIAVDEAQSVLKEANQQEPNK